MPLLYVRGGDDRGGIEVYLDGFRKSGIEATGKIIPGGPFSADGSSGALASALREFRISCES